MKNEKLYSVIILTQTRFRNRLIEEQENDEYYFDSYHTYVAISEITGREKELLIEKILVNSRGSVSNVIISTYDNKFVYTLTPFIGHHDEFIPSKHILYNGKMVLNQNIIALLKSNERDLGLQLFLNEIKPYVEQLNIDSAVFITPHPIWEDNNVLYFRFNSRLYI